MNTTIRLYLTIIFAVLLSSVAVSAQSGGSFEIKQSVIASGGGTSSGGEFQVKGTSGQPVAGTQSDNAPFNLQSGFWTARASAPPAANVSITGRVLKHNGRGLPDVLVTLFKHGGVDRTRTDSSGNFRFDDVEIGQTVIIQPFALRFIFLPKVITVTENLPVIIFNPL